MLSSLRCANARSRLFRFIVASVLCAALIACTKKPRGIDGDWIGVLTVNGKTDHGVLHLQTDRDGKLTVLLDSRDDKVTGLPGDNVGLKGNELSFDVPAVHGNHHGTLSSDGAVIKGIWTKDGSHPLDFTRQPEAADDTSEP